MKSSVADVSAALDDIKAATGESDTQENHMSNESELVEAQQRIAELETALAKATTSEPIASEAAVPDEVEDLLKSVPEPVRKMLEEQSAAIAKAESEAAEATEALRKARDEQADKEAIAKAAEWTSLSLDPAVVGPELRRLAEFDTDLSKAVESALEAANAQAESAGIFTEIGKAGLPDAGDAYAKMATLAKAKVEAGQAGTFEQAFAAVVGDNPDLYSQHLTEKGS